MITNFKLFENNKEDFLVNYLDDNFVFKQPTFNEYYWLVCENDEYEIIIKIIQSEDCLVVIKSEKKTESFADILFKENEFDSEHEFIEKIEFFKEKCLKEKAIKDFNI